MASTLPRFYPVQFESTGGDFLFGVWDARELRFVTDEHGAPIGFARESNARLMSRVVESRNS